MKKKIIMLINVSLVFLMLLGFNTNVLADENRSEKSARGVYIRTCVGYEPSSTSIVYEYKSLGNVSGDNRSGSQPLTLTYSYATSGTVSASISGYANGSVEAKYVIAKMTAQMGVQVAASRSWTKGTSSGATYNVPAGKMEVLEVYIPGVKTSGRLKYEVYMDGYPNDKSYEYITLNSSTAPQKGSLHFKIKPITESSKI